MTGCGDSSALEVVENSTDYVITCNNVGGTGRQVRWERGAGIAAGECAAVNNCQSTVAVIAVLSRPSYSTSTMTVKSATRSLWGNRTVKCYTILLPSVTVLGEDSCTLEVVCEYGVLYKHFYYHVNNKRPLNVLVTKAIWTLIGSGGGWGECVCVWGGGGGGGGGVCNDHRWDWPAGSVKSFNGAIFSTTINVTNAKLCMMVRTIPCALSVHTTFSKLSRSHDYQGVLAGQFVFLLIKFSLYTIGNYVIDIMNKVPPPPPPPTFACTQGT